MEENLSATISHLHGVHLPELASPRHISSQPVREAVPFWNEDYLQPYSSIQLSKHYIIFFDTCITMPVYSLAANFTTTCQVLSR